MPHLVRAENGEEAQGVGKAEEQDGGALEDLRKTADGEAARARLEADPREKRGREGEE